MKNFGWDDCWLENRKASVFGMQIALIALIAPVSVVQTERGKAMFLLMTDRISQYALDLNAEELIG